MRATLRAIYVLVDERDYIELRKRLLEEGKTLARWVRERIKEYLNRGGEGCGCEENCTENSGNGGKEE